MLNFTKIEIFRNLTQPATITELSEILKFDQSTISKAVDSLEKDGFVVRQKKGKEVHVSRSDSLHSQALKDIILEFPRIPWDKIFTTSSLHVLGALECKHSIADIAGMTGLDRRTVSSAIRESGKYGIILKIGNKYILSERHSLVRKFVSNFWQYVTNKKLRDISLESVLIWQRGPEFLFKLDNESDMNVTEVKNCKIQPTAINVFHKYGLKILSDTAYFFCTKRNLRPEDYFIHTILIDPHSPIYNSYALAFSSKLEQADLFKIGRHYNMENHIEKLLEYLATMKKNSDFVLPWNEYESLLKDLE
ncbi:winged helix-turn-helix domain-containing protein [uncultured Methanolobus sp.]|uniref:winged helix-turn-helix domain-containing protein n=1 Tax=uncultured Methanolobus sp. TaxID=218300 RepID=UPI002AABD330|nr:winged helix-turn-helix domain-containing protein [uncultured Methanolobus sp.]